MEKYVSKNAPQASIGSQEGGYCTVRLRIMATGTTGVLLIKRKLLPPRHKP